MLGLYRCGVVWWLMLGLYGWGGGVLTNARSIRVWSDVMTNARFIRMWDGVMTNARFIRVWDGVMTNARFMRGGFVNDPLYQREKSVWRTIVDRGSRHLKQPPDVGTVSRMTRCEISCRKTKYFETNIKLISCFSLGSRQCRVTRSFACRHFTKIQWKVFPTNPIV